MTLLLYTKRYCVFFVYFNTNYDCKLPLGVRLSIAHLPRCLVSARFIPFLFTGRCVSIFFPCFFLLFLLGSYCIICIIYAFYMQGTFGYGRLLMSFCSDLYVLDVFLSLCMKKLHLFLKNISFLFVVLKIMHIFVLLLNERCFTY